MKDTFDVELARFGARLELARRHLYDYCLLQYPGFYKPNRTFLKDICDQIEGFVKHSSKRFLILNAPPRHGKSLTAQSATAWLLGDNPSNRVMTASYNERLASTFSKNVRNIIQTKKASDRVGDFEPVISLLDAYNILQSDRVIDRERLVDAILAFYGMDLNKEDQEDLKESRTIAGVPADAKIEYIVKNINEADADVLRSAILADIHKISMTPDMSDQNFAGNSSGVALQYKLLAFEQHIKDKERYFENALVNRFRLYNGVLASIKKMNPIESSDIDVVFRRALPQNDLETSQMINNLTDIVDRETLVSRLSFIQDAKETVKLAQEEQEDSLKLGNYGTDKPNENENDNNDSFLDAD